MAKSTRSPGPSRCPVCDDFAGVLRVPKRRGMFECPACQIEFEANPEIQPPPKAEPMPRISKIAVNYERKLNLGNYSSATIGVSTWVDLDEGDDAASAIAEAQSLCRSQARNEAVRLMTPSPVSVTAEVNQS